MKMKDGVLENLPSGSIKIAAQPITYTMDSTMIQAPLQLRANFVIHRNQCETANGQCSLN